MASAAFFTILKNTCCISSPPQYIIGRLLSYFLMISIVLNPNSLLILKSYETRSIALSSKAAMSCWEWVPGDVWLNSNMFVMIRPARIPDSEMEPRREPILRFSMYICIPSKDTEQASDVSRLRVVSSNMRCLTTWAEAMIAARGLLISWAMPAANPPRASILSDWASISSMRVLSVVSSTRMTTPSTPLAINGK